MKIQPRTKKTETIEVRVSPETKADFMAACREKGETASMAVRKFINTYIADARRAPAVSSVKAIAAPAFATLARSRLSYAAGLIAAAGAVWGLVATPSVAADPRLKAVFTFLDADANGRLTLNELAHPRSTRSLEKFYSFFDVRVGAVTPPEIAEHYTVADFVVQNDINQDGAITLKEFSAVSSVVDTVIKFPLLDADADGDGRVTKSELVTYYNDMTGDAALDDYVWLMFDAVFAAHDTDGDGGLTPADFSNAPWPTQQ